VQRSERIKALKEDRNATIAAFAKTMPKHLDRFSSAERNQIYKKLRLRVDVDGDGPLLVTGAMIVDEGTVCITGGTGW
jgi:hypothetical protein